MATMIPTHDEKIMNFDIYEGHKAFMEMFDEDEIAEMRRWLERELGYDYSYNDDDEIDALVITDYVKEWLRQNIRDDIISGSRKLFNIVYDVL